MQKKIIALAIAGLSGAAFAQSNVTLYGQVDTYLGNFNASGNGARGTTVLNSGGLGQSRLGFKGAEDLGNGLKAVFALEYGLTVDKSAGIGTDPAGADTTSNNARQQLLGLAGGFGTVAAGYLQTAAYDWSVKYSALGGTALDPHYYSARAAGSGAGTGINSYDRAPNAVAYISPNLNGLTLKANYAQLNEGAAANNGQRRGAYLLAADYDNGPLSAGLVYRQVNKANQADGLSGRYETAIGASYNLGAATLIAGAQSIGISNTTKRAAAYSFGAKAPVSAAGTVVAEFGRGIATGTGTAVNTFSLAYLHGLSKRTTAYAGYINQRGKNTAENSGLVSVGGATAADANGTINGVVLGLQHKF